MNRKAIYPGSFDPITMGHLDIVERSAKLFDVLYVCVADNGEKNCCFTTPERVEMIKKATAHLPNVEVISTADLVVMTAKRLGCVAIVRGLRRVTDFEFEFQIAAANEFIDHDIEMVFMMSSLGKNFISSSSIKELYSYGVDITPLVPEIVLEYFPAKLKRKDKK